MTGRSRVDPASRGRTAVAPMRSVCGPGAEGGRFPVRILPRRAPADAAPRRRSRASSGFRARTGPSPPAASRVPTRSTRPAGSRARLQGRRTRAERGSRLPAPRPPARASPRRMAPGSQTRRGRTWGLLPGDRLCSSAEHVRAPRLRRLLPSRMEASCLRWRGARPGGAGSGPRASMPEAPRPTSLQTAIARDRRASPHRHERGDPEVGWSSRGNFLRRRPTAVRNGEGRPGCCRGAPGAFWIFDQIRCSLTRPW